MINIILIFTIIRTILCNVSLDYSCLLIQTFTKTIDSTNLACSKYYVNYPSTPAYTSFVGFSITKFTQNYSSSNTLVINVYMNISSIVGADIIVDGDCNINNKVTLLQLRFMLMYNTVSKLFYAQSLTVTSLTPLIAFANISSSHSQIATVSLNTLTNNTSWRSFLYLTGFHIQTDTKPQLGFNANIKNIYKIGPNPNVEVQFSTSLTTVQHLYTIYLQFIAFNYSYSLGGAYQARIYKQFFIGAPYIDIAMTIHGLPYYFTNPQNMIFFGISGFKNQDMGNVLQWKIQYVNTFLPVYFSWQTNSVGTFYQSIISFSVIGGAVSSDRTCCFNNSLYIPLSGDCSACAAGLYYSAQATTCSLCSYQCTFCYHYPQCVTCSPTYTPIKGGCSNQPACNQTNADHTSSICTKCISPFYVNGSNQCVCSLGTYPISTTVCGLCVYNCQECTDGLTCIACKPGSTAARDGCTTKIGCIDVILNTVNESCQICGTPFLLTPVIGGCTNITGCSAVNSDLTKSDCTACVVPLVLYSIISTNDSCDCPVGQFMISDNPYTCQLCVLYCNHCLDSTSCYNCSVGNVVAGGCSVQIGCNSVVSATNTAVCNNCSSPYIYVVSGGCSDVLGCILVVSNLSESLCISCKPPMTLIDSGHPNNTCECPLKYYIDIVSVSCIGCVFGCDKCSNNNSCINCQMNKNVVIGGCSSKMGCVQVEISTISQKCLTCSSLYPYLVSNGCTNVKGCNFVNTAYNYTYCSICYTPLIIDSVNTTNDTCKCPTTNSYIHYESSTASWSCPLCSYFCLRCTSDYVCLFCSKGKPIYGGCSKTVGCIQVFPSPTTSICKACDSQFTLNGERCVCGDGFWMVTGHCTDVLGCLAVKRSNSTNRCIGCNLLQKFIFNNGTCVCTSGYYLHKQKKNCSQVCGDGKLFYLQCDDGNKVDGDGCSSQCKKQRNYQCINGNETSPSQCFVIFTSVSIFLVYTEKVLQKNQAKFTFKINTLPKVKISPTLITGVAFTAIPMNKMTNWTLDSSGSLTITVQYRQSLQQELGSIKVDMNTSFCLTPSVSLDFDMILDNVPLFFDGDGFQFFKYIIYGVIGLVILQFVIGSLVHKMIGMQLLSTILIIFYISCLISPQSEPITMLRYFSILNLNINYIWSNKDNFYEINASGSYSQQQLAASQTIMLTIYLLILVFLVVRKIFVSVYQNENYKIIILSKIHHYVIFPIVSSFCYIGIFSYICLPDQLPIAKDSSMYFTYLVTGVVTNGLVLFNQIAASQKQVLLKYNLSQIYLFGLKQCKVKYISYYLSNMLCLYLIICLGALSIITYQMQILLIEAIIYLIFIINYMPYEQILHNITIIINSATVVFICIWGILQKYFISIVGKNQKYFLVTLMLFIVSCIVLSTINILKKLGTKTQHNEIIQEIAKINKQKQIKIKQQMNVKINNMSLISNLVQSSKKQQIKKKKHKLQKRYNEFIQQQLIM